nr:TPA_asm: hypothetical protein HUJ06_013711 [Nelumbo nucifera]
MESLSSSLVPSYWDYLVLYFLRPILAVAFAVSLLLLGWFLAWKLVLVHVPLVREVCGLNKKPKRVKPPTRRLSRIYKSMDSRNSAFGW